MRHREKIFLTGQRRCTVPLLALALLAVTGIGGCSWDSALYDEFVSNDTVKSCPDLKYILTSNNTRCKDASNEECKDFKDALDLNLCPVDYPECLKDENGDNYCTSVVECKNENDCSKAYSSVGWIAGKCEKSVCKAEACNEKEGYVVNTKTSKCEALTCEAGKHKYYNSDTNKVYCEDDSIENCGIHGYICIEKVPGWIEGTCPLGECIASKCDPNGYQLSKDGKCITGCQLGQVSCNNKCIDPLIDPTFCGAKLNGLCIDESPDSENYRGQTCTGGQICNNGICECPTGPDGTKDQIFCQIEPQGFSCVDPKIKNEFCGCTEEASGENCALRAGEDGKSYNCVDGVCKLTNCDAGETQCGDVCINLFAADANNCGKCGLVCSTQAPPNSSAAGCDKGICRFTCNEGYFNACLLTAKSDEEKSACTLSTSISCVKIGTNTCCGDTCINCEDQNTDKETFACSAGSCIVSSCKIGQQYCSGECKTVAEDMNNCGSCGNVCGTGTTCTEGICKCASSQTNCGSDAVPACKDLQSDKDFCGSCGTNCEGIKPANSKVTACSQGECKFECESGYFNKGNGTTATTINCVLIGTNTCCGSKCESCDAKASAGTYYMCDKPDNSGKCVKSSCGAGQMLCNGECSTTASDSNNCGACGHKCGAKTNCSNSLCICSTAGETNCGSDASPQCKNLKTDTANCGGCNITCASLAPSNTDVAACSAGICQFACKDGYYNKGGGTTATTINCVKIGTNTCCGNNCINCEDSNTAKVTYACSNAQCVESSCGAGELLCNNSCKTVATDKNNCGSCGNICGSGTSCTNGKCQCSAAGTTNCGTDKNPNCVNTKTNKDFCGNCATSCADIAPANAHVKSTGGCDNSICQFECDDGYYNKGTGTTSTTINCVKIGTNTCCGSGCDNCDAKASQGTYYMCDKADNSGKCVKSACGSGQMLCNSTCSTVASDNNNCGSCGHVCGSGSKCQNGSCVCTEAGKTNCGTDLNPQCKPLTTDVSNCGGCGITCASQAPENTVVSSCSGSTCQFACADGYQNKGSGVTSATINCVRKGSNTCCGNNCTNCEDQNTASAKYSCSNGSCIQSSCGAGEQLCGASCQNTSTSSNHCGACNNKCGSGTSCDAGKCTCTAANTTNCGSDASPNCVNTQTDANFCGNCATKCSTIAPANAKVKSNGGCSGGVCQFECNQGFYNKGSGITSTTINCVQIGTNTCCGNNCANCDAMADNGVYYTCNDGSCTKSACGAGQMLCNGNCASLTDKATCGSCNKSCGGGNEFTCDNGSCVCTDNKTNCGTDANPSCVVLTSTNNCGYCGHQCGAGTTCSNGNCVCENSKTNCGSDANPACYSLSSDASHCGSCQTSCDAIKPLNSHVKANGGCVQSVCHFECDYGYYNAGSNDTATTINCVSNSTASCCGQSCTDCNTQKGTLGGNDVVVSVGCSTGTCQATACKTGYTVSAGKCTASGDATCCGTGCINCNQANNAKAGVCNANSKKCEITTCADGYHLDKTGVDNKCVLNTETACATPGSAVTSNCSSDNSKHYAGGYCKPDGTCFVFKCTDGYVVANDIDCVPCTAQDVSQCSGIANAATYGCSNSTCIATSCSDNYHVYNNACEQNSNAHCGAHNNKCTTAKQLNSSSVSCSNAGICEATACNSTYHVYNGQCEADDVNNCGSHGTACNYANGVGSCTSATCSLASCNTGFHKNGNVCEENNIAHCGAHGATCTTATVEHSTAVECTNVGVCQATACITNFHPYNNGCEENTTSNCGQHGATCTTATVEHSSAVECTQNGVCQATACDGEYQVVDGACVENQQN